MNVDKSMNEPVSVGKSVKEIMDVGKSVNEVMIDWLIDWLIDWTLFLKGEDISTKADSHICRCYSTTNNQNFHSDILWQKDINK